MATKRLPAIANSAVWEKMTKTRPGIRWDNIVDRVWREIGGSQEEILSVEKVGGHKTGVKEWMERREKPALEKKLEGEEH